MKYTGLLLLISCMACNRPNESLNTSVTYFFDCNIDGKKLHIETEWPNTSNNGIVLGSQASTEITTLASSQQCNQPGSYCFIHAGYIKAQTTGTFSPYSFSIQLTEGSKTIFYYAGAGYPQAQGNLKLTISKIERLQNQTVTGIIHGSFSGTIVKSVNQTPTSGTELPISGSFKLPISQ